jgi:hypothetical protein
MQGSTPLPVARPASPPDIAFSLPPFSSGLGYVLMPNVSTDTHQALRLTSPAGSCCASGVALLSSTEQLILLLALGLPASLSRSLLYGMMLVCRCTST